MVCEKCGAKLNENCRVCPQCGAPIEGEEQNITPTSTYEGPLGNPTPVLVWGIIGLSFALTPYINFLGIIFSAIGLKKANQYSQFTGGLESKQASVGRGLSKAGLITGIILTVVFTVLIIALIITASQSSGYHRYRY